MAIEFKEKNLGIKVRAIMGVPEEILTDDIITSPSFDLKATKYINRYISKSLEDYENLDLDRDMLSISYVYYICYLLCPGMYSRLPKQMENVNTKTVLQATDWYALASEMLDKCNGIMDDIISEINEEDISYGSTFAVLSDESEYPNTMI